MLNTAAVRSEAIPTDNPSQQDLTETAGMQDLRGTFGLLPLNKLLSWLKNNQHSGVLRLSNGTQRKEFLVRRGELISFRSNRHSEQLETMLARQGLAELSVLQELHKNCRRQNRSFAQELTKRQLLSKSELRLWLKQSLLIALDDTLQWSDGSFFFRFQAAEQVGKAPLVPPQPANAQTAPQVEEILAAEAIFAEINHQIINGRVELPPMPDTLIKVRDCLNHPDWDSQDLLKIIMADQLLTSSILKAANSSRYGFTSRVSSLQHAIVLLGMKSIWGIVTHQSLLSSFSRQQQGIQRVVDHSFLCAVIARQIATAVRCDEEDAFACALLHDIGKTVMLNQLADMQLPAGLCDKLVDRFHGEAGLLLAARWNLPEPVLETIEYHHQPDRAAANRKLVEIVSLADSLVNRREPLAELLEQYTALDPASIDLEQLAGQVEELEQTLHARD